MLVAKLTKEVEKVYQAQGSLEVKTFTCDHLTARVMRYDLNSICMVYYKLGKVDSGAKQHERFKQLIQGFLNLGKEDVATWGTDDSVLLEIVANKLGLEVEEVFELEGETFKQ